MKLNITQLLPKPVSQSVFFNDKRKIPIDRTESYPVFQQIKNPTNKQSTRKQPHLPQHEEYIGQN